jgi:hypothetical protein
MSSKTISVSSDLLGGYFKPKMGQNNSGRATRRNRSNTIPKQQILNEMRAAQQSIMKDASMTSRAADASTTSSSSSSANQPMDAFEESRNYLRQKTTTENLQRPTYPQPARNPAPPHPPIIKPIMHQQQQHQQSPTTLHLPPPSYKLVSAPLFGCLKQGLLPTYRTFKAQNQHSSIMPGIGGAAAPLRHDNFEEKLMVSTAEKAQALRQATEMEDKPSNNINNEDVTAAAAAQHYPPMTKTALTCRKYTVGKRHNANKVGVLISGKDHRETLKRKQCDAKQMPMMELREKLAKRGIVHTTTTAPRHLLQNMYENSCVNLCGELNVRNHPRV